MSTQSFNENFETVFSYSAVRTRSNLEVKKVLLKVDTRNDF